MCTQRARLKEVLTTYYRTECWSLNRNGYVLLVGCAMVAAWLITAAQLPQQLAEMLGPLVDSPRLLMAVIMLLVLCVGMVK